MSAPAAEADLNRRSRTWIGANVLFALMFGFSVVVQVNDPDPWGWMAVYGLAAVACILAALGRTRVALPALVAVVALVWAATLAPQVVGEVEFLSMFGAFEMESVAIEEAREMYGLLVVAGWMAVVVFGARG